MARRRYQRGQLFLRGKRNKVWIGRWREDEVQTDGTIKRVHKSEILGAHSDFPTKRLAARELESRLNSLNSPAYRAARRITFKELADKWQTTILPTMKPSTQSSMKAHLNHFQDLSAMRLTDLSAEFLQSWISGMTIHPKTLRNRLSTLRIIWNSAKAWGYVTHNPFEGLRLPRNIAPIRKAFTTEQVTRILTESANDPTLRAFLWIAAQTGMRCGEICALAAEDVDHTRRLIRVRRSSWRGKVTDPKTSTSSRTFSISKALSEEIVKSLPKEGLLFTTRTGKPWDQTNILSWKLYPLLDRLEIPRAGLHAFRHHAASYMDQSGAPLKLRQERLGHSDIALTLNVYTHVDNEQDVAYVEAWDKDVLDLNVPRSEVAKTEVVHLESLPAA